MPDNTPLTPKGGCTILPEPLEVSLCGWAKSEARWAPPGQVCWSDGHAALGHTGLSMEKPRLPARSFMVDGGSHSPIHFLHMPPTPSPTPAPTQPGASTGIQHSWWDIAKRECRSCGDSGIPFLQARCSGRISKLLSLDRNLLCYCGSQRVVPEPGKCFQLDL